MSMNTVTPFRAMSTIVALALATGCNGRLAHHFDEKFDQVLEIPPGTRRVEIEVFEGALSVAVGDPGVVECITSTRRAADTEEGLAILRGLDLRLVVAPSEPGVLTLRGPTLPEGLARLEHRMITKVVVRVPPELEVGVVTGLGHVSAVDRRAAVRLETGHGDVRLDGCWADATLRSGHGVVIVQGQRGGLDVETVESETMQVFIDEIGASGLRLVTETGSIQAHVPKGSGFVLDAETKWGRAANAFGVPVEPITGTARGKTMRGEVGGGGPRVVLRATDGGNISLSARVDK